MKLFVPTLIFSIIINSCSSGSSENLDNVQTNTIPSLEKIWETEPLLKGNESVIYDVTTDAIYVSCMGEMPDDAIDGDGYVAKLNPNGSIEKLHWISGLNCPKGMAIYDNKLYVTDIGKLITIDLLKGEIINSVIIKGGEFLNDVDVASNGDLFLTETRKNHILIHTDGKTKLYYSTVDIGGLNGIHVNGERLLFTGKEGTYFLSKDLKITPASTSIEGADGIETYKSGYFGSSWKGKIFYFTENGETKKLIDTWDNEVYSADIDVVEAQNLLISPTLFSNKVIAYRIN